MEELDIPILRSIYELYKSFHQFRSLVPKADRYTLWQRSENTVLEILESILLASQAAKQGKRAHLDLASVKLNTLRLLVRLAKDTKVIDIKKYIAIQQSIDEIGRMLGGWIKSTITQSGTPPPIGIFEERRKCRTDDAQRLSLRLLSQLLLTFSRPSFQLRVT